MARLSILSIVMIINLNSALAAQSNYEAFLNEAANLHQQATDTFLNITPSDNPSFTTENPDEINLINEDLNALGNQQFLEDEYAQLLQQHFYQAPRFSFDAEDSALTQAQIIQDNALAITQGVANSDTQCQAEKICTPTFSETTCQEPLFSGEQICTEHLQARVVTPELRQDTLIVKLQQLSFSWFWSVSASSTIPLSTPQNATFSNVSANINIAPEIGDLDQACPNFEARLKDWYFSCNGQNCPFDKEQFNNNVTFRVTALPHCNNQQQLALTWQATWFNGGYLSQITEWVVELEIDYQPQTQVELTWDNRCDIYQQLVTQGVCELTAPPICLSGPESRDIDGHTVTADCWQRQSRYQCGINGNNSCAMPRSQGCEQIGSRCMQEVAGVCVQYEQTLRCPETTCDDQIPMVCDDQSTFCIEGDCNTPDDPPFNQVDFVQTAAILSAFDQATNEFNSNTQQVFKGTGMQCRRKATGFNNCCADKGWGQDIGLASCDSNEKRLGQARQDGLCAYVGEYCANSVLGVCITRKQSYCCFDHKLSAIVQIQGRGQMGLGYGEVEQPNCRGLSLSELQRIDFERLDFSSFVADLQNQTTLPNEVEIQAELKARIEAFYQGRQ
ncbi:MAG: conjugal transfer protein TraN [Gammaproteobacteria bacterium]